MSQIPTVVPNRAEIRKRRLAAGLTPERLAASMSGGCHPQTIRRIETAKSWGQPRVSAYLIANLAQALNEKVPTEVSDITIALEKGLKAA